MGRRLNATGNGRNSKCKREEGRSDKARGTCLGTAELTMPSMLSNATIQSRVVKLTARSGRARSREGASGTDLVGAHAVSRFNSRCLAPMEPLLSSINREISARSYAPRLR